MLLKNLNFIFNCSQIRNSKTLVYRKGVYHEKEKPDSGIFANFGACDINNSRIRRKFEFLGG
jgi:hypothetical protein